MKGMRRFAERAQLTGKQGPRERETGAIPRLYALRRWTLRCHPNLTHELVDIGRGIAANIRAAELPFLKSDSPIDCTLHEVLDLAKIDGLDEAGHTLPELRLNCMPVNTRSVFTKMQEKPKLEAGIGYCKSDSISFGLLFCVLEIGVLIDIKYAPDFVVQKILITRSASGPPGKL